MVKWSVPAKHDLKAIYDYIKRDSEYYAKKVTHNIIEKSEELDRFPQMGRIVPETEDSSINELIKEKITKYAEKILVGSRTDPGIAGSPVSYVG